MNTDSERPYLTPALSLPLCGPEREGICGDAFTPGGALLRLPGANFSLPLQGCNLSRLTSAATKKLP